MKGNVIHIVKIRLGKISNLQVTNEVLILERTQIECASDSALMHSKSHSNPSKLYAFQLRIFVATKKGIIVNFIRQISNWYEVLAYSLKKPA